MGNAQGEGVNHFLPANGGDYYIIVIGLQESTYTVEFSAEHGEHSAHSAGHKEDSMKNSTGLSGNLGLGSLIRREHSSDEAERTHHTRGNTLNLLEPCIRNLSKSFTSIIGRCRLRFVCLFVCECVCVCV